MILSASQSQARHGRRCPNGKHGSPSYRPPFRASLQRDMFRDLNASPWAKQRNCTSGTALKRRLPTNRRMLAGALCCSIPTISHRGAASRRQNDVLSLNPGGMGLSTDLAPGCGSLDHGRYGCCAQQQTDRLFVPRAIGPVRPTKYIGQIVLSFLVGRLSRVQRRDCHGAGSVTEEMTTVTATLELWVITDAY